MSKRRNGISARFNNLSQDLLFCFFHLSEGLLGTCLSLVSVGWVFHGTVTAISPERDRCGAVA